MGEWKKQPLQRTLLFTHPLAISLSLLQSRCILFIYPDTVAQFSPNEEN